MSVSKSTLSQNTLYFYTQGIVSLKAVATENVLTFYDKINSASSILLSGIADPINDYDAVNKKYINSIESISVSTILKPPLAGSIYLYNNLGVNTLNFSSNSSTNIYAGTNIFNGYSLFSQPINASKGIITTTAISENVNDKINLYNNITTGTIYLGNNLSGFLSVGTMSGRNIFYGTNTFIGPVIGVNTGEAPNFTAPISASTIIAPNGGNPVFLYNNLSGTTLNFSSSSSTNIYAGSSTFNGSTKYNDTIGVSTVLTNNPTLKTSLFNNITTGTLSIGASTANITVDGNTKFTNNISVNTINTNQSGPIFLYNNISANTLNIGSNSGVNVMPGTNYLGPIYISGESISGQRLLYSTLTTTTNLVANVSLNLLLTTTRYLDPNISLNGTTGVITLENGVYEVYYFINIIKTANNTLTRFGSQLYYDKTGGTNWTTVPSTLSTGYLTTSGVGYTLSNLCVLSPVTSNTTMILNITRYQGGGTSTINANEAGIYIKRLRPS